MDNLKCFQVEVRPQDNSFVRIVPLNGNNSHYNSSHFDFKEEEIENLSEIRDLYEQHGDNQILNIKAHILPKLKAINSYIERQNLDSYETEARNPRMCGIGVSRQEKKFLKELNMPFAFRELGNRIPLSIYIFPVEII